MTMDFADGFAMAAAASPAAALPVLTAFAWSPSDKMAGVALSNANKTASIAAAGWSGVRAVQSCVVGADAVIYEITVTASPGGYIDFGVARAGTGLDGSPGGGDKVFYRGVNGKRTTEIAGTYLEFDYGPTFAVGNVIRMQIDGGGTARFMKNGVDLGVAASGLSGEWFPWVRMYDAGSAVVAT